MLRNDFRPDSRRCLFEVKYLVYGEYKTGQHVATLQRIVSREDITVGALAIDFNQALFRLDEPHQLGAVHQVIMCSFTPRRIGIIRGFHFDH